MFSGSTNPTAWCSHRIPLGIEKRSGNNTRDVSHKNTRNSHTSFLHPLKNDSFLASVNPCNHSNTISEWAWAEPSGRKCTVTGLEKMHVVASGPVHSFISNYPEQRELKRIICELTSTAFSDALWRASEIVVGCTPLLSKFKHCFNNAPANTTTTEHKWTPELLQHLLKHCPPKHCTWRIKYPG